MTKKLLFVLPILTVLGLSSCTESEEANIATNPNSAPAEEAAAPEADAAPEEKEMVKESVKSGSEVDTETYRQILKDESRLVIADFHAEWCGPCKMLDPVLKKIADKHSGEVLLIKINVDNNGALAEELGVQGIPHVEFYREGEKVDQFVGLISEEEILEYVQKHSSAS
ncbi:MAG: thioredoxin family protein [Verrucomicrobiota bacterium]